MVRWFMVRLWHWMSHLPSWQCELSPFLLETSLLSFNSTSSTYNISPAGQTGDLVAEEKLLSEFGSPAQNMKQLWVSGDFRDHWWRFEDLKKGQRCKKRPSSLAEQKERFQNQFCSSLESSGLTVSAGWRRTYCSSGHFENLDQTCQNLFVNENNLRVMKIIWIWISS